MTEEYETIGPIKYHKGRLKGEKWKSIPREYLQVWRNIDSETLGIPKCGVGYPILGMDDSVVNFLKLYPIDSTRYEESFIDGFPIAQGRVVFGDKRTNEILITIDCRTALILHLATDLATIAVLYSENLKPVCQYLKKRYPKNTYKVCFNGDEKAQHSTIFHLAYLAAVSIRAEICASGPLSYSDIFEEEEADGIINKINNPTVIRPLKVINSELYALKIPNHSLAWPNPVNGSSMLANLIIAVQRHVVMPEYMGLIVSLWIIHTYALESFRFSPLLAIISPDIAVGKATLLALLKRLCSTAHRTSRISFADLLTLIEERCNTVLFDKGDSLFRSQQFVEFLDSSHDRTSGGITALGKEKNILESKDTFVAKAIKSHIALPESLIYRSIQIQLIAKQQDEIISSVDPYRQDTNDELTVLAAQIKRWSDDHLIEIKNITAVSLELGNEHINNTFSPLIAIAKVIGKDALQRTEAATRELLAHVIVKSEGMQLLEHLSEVLQEIRGEKILSSELVDALCSRDDWPWAKCNKGKPLDHTLLAKLILEFDLEPERVRIGELTKRGYHRADLEKAFSRKLRSSETVEKKSVLTGTLS
jgi:hypothetical protein